MYFDANLVLERHEDRTICLGLYKGNVVRVSQIVELTGAAYESVTSAIKNSLREDVLEPVFRVNTDAVLVGYENAWTKKLSSLKREFKTVDGAVIDGSEPSNIIVGFRIPEDE